MSSTRCSRILGNQKVKRSTTGRKAFIVVLVLVLTILINKLFVSDESTTATAAGPEFIARSHQDSVSSTNSKQALQDESDLKKTYSLNQNFDLKAAGGTYPIPSLEASEINVDENGRVKLENLPEFRTQFQGRVAGLSKKNEFVFYTIDQKLQTYAEELVKKADAPHVAIVAMDPKTGKILAMAEKSSTISKLATHSGFPAASLFKIITTAAALESDTLAPYSLISFRGGLYSLNKGNYLPNTRRDKRRMTMEEALAKSCNAVFGRIALLHLAPGVLRKTVDRFGFNSSIGFDSPLVDSSAYVPNNDDLEMSRTGAGFGDVTISPIHAAAIMAGIANGGLLPRPHVVQQLVSRDGAIVYQAQPEMITRIVSGKTAGTLLDMMQATTTMGTSHKEFMKKKRPVLPVSVAAKTGTLNGLNPKGTNHWFVAAAPAENPKIALSVIVVNPKFTRTKASALGREIIEKYLGL